MKAYIKIIMKLTTIIIIIIIIIKINSTGCKKTDKYAKEANVAVITDAMGLISASRTARRCRESLLYDTLGATFSISARAGTSVCREKYRSRSLRSTLVTCCQPKRK